jgi:2-methylcitrate dehydratase PrpD
VDTTLGALSHAACQIPFSLYAPVRAGSTARNVYPGFGAMLGLTAVAAACAGVAGPPGALAEWARRALGLELTVLSQGAGEWLILQGYLKRWPAVRHVHYGIAAAERWRAEAVQPPEAITAMTLRIYGEALTYCGNRAPRSAIQAQFSLSHGLAWTLAQGAPDAAAYTPAALADPQYTRLEALLVLEEDTGLTQAGARGATLTVMAGGRRWEGSVDGVPGDPAAPLTRSEVAAKFCAFAGRALAPEAVEATVSRLLDGPLDAPL